MSRPLKVPCLFLLRPHCVFHYICRLVRTDRFPGGSLIAYPSVTPFPRPTQSFPPLISFIYYINSNEIRYSAPPWLDQWYLRLFRVKGKQKNYLTSTSNSAIRGDRGGLKRSTVNTRSYKTTRQQRGSLKSLISMVNNHSD